MHTFYKDKTSLFEFKINVEGAELADTFARVILENNNRKYLFEGKIANGICTVEMPALKEFKETKNSNLQVEVIAESSFFIPYTGEYEVKESKKVVVEMISSAKTNIETKPKVIVETIQKEVSIPKTNSNEKNKIEPKKENNFKKNFIDLFEKHKGNIKVEKTSLMFSKDAIELSNFLKEKKVIKAIDEIKFQSFIDNKITPNKLPNIKKAFGFEKNKF